MWSWVIRMTELRDFRPSDFRDGVVKLKLKSGLTKAKELISQFLIAASDDSGAEADKVFVVARKLSFYGWIERFAVKDIETLLSGCEPAIAQAFLSGLSPAVAKKIKLAVDTESTSAKADGLEVKSLEGVMRDIERLLLDASEANRVTEVRRRLAQLRDPMPQTESDSRVAGFPIARHRSPKFKVSTEFVGPSALSIESKVERGHKPYHTTGTVKWFRGSGVVSAAYLDGVIVNIGNQDQSSHAVPMEGTTLIYNVKLGNLAEPVKKKQPNLSKD
jgi:hypothetical protein